MLPQFGTNPIARRQRVYYTETSSIFEGMPVCFEFDATTNVLGYDKGAGGNVDSQDTPTTTAEGNQNEGKFLRVEDPDADNIHAFAGVIAGTSEAGKVGPRWVDIFIPNGAIVPVRSDQNCTVGRTILAVHTAEQHLTSPYEQSGRAVAIAWETKDTATTTGIVLAKLSTTLFIYQKGDNATLLVDDEDTGDVTINQIRVAFAQASGRATAFQIRAHSIAGTQSCWDYGLAMDVSADLAGGLVTNSFNGSGHWLNIGSTTITGGSIVSALRAGIYEDGSGNTFTSVGAMSPLSLAVQFTTDPSGNLAMIYMRSDGSNAVDYLFIAETAAAIGAAAQGNSSTQAWGTDDITIKIKVGGTDYWLYASVAAGAA